MAIKKVIWQKGVTTTANILAGATSNELFITETEQYEHAPLSTIVISNADTVHLTVLLDGQIAIPVQPNTVIIAENQNFRTFTIRNDDAAVAHTAGKIDILVEQHE